MCQPTKQPAKLFFTGKQMEVYSIGPFAQDDLLFYFRYTSSVFEQIESIPPSRNDFSSDVVIMDTQTRLFVWLANGALKRLKQPGLEIAQVHNTLIVFHRVELHVKY